MFLFEYAMRFSLEPAFIIIDPIAVMAPYLRDEVVLPGIRQPPLSMVTALTAPIPFSMASSFTVVATLPNSEVVVDELFRMISPSLNVSDDAPETAFVKVHEPEPTLTILVLLNVPLNLISWFRLPIVTVPDVDRVPPPVRLPNENERLSALTVEPVGMFIVPLGSP